MFFIDGSETQYKDWKLYLHLPWTRFCIFFWMTLFTLRLGNREADGMGKDSEKSGCKDKSTKSAQ